MRYSELIQFHVAASTKAAIKEAAASRGIKPSEWLRSAADLALAMDNAVNTTEEASR